MTQNMSIINNADAILIGKHTGTEQNLIFVLHGDDATDAIVNVNDPELVLYVPKDYIETGDSLCWVSNEELARRGDNVCKQRLPLNKEEV